MRNRLPVALLVLFVLVAASAPLQAQTSEIDQTREERDAARAEKAAKAAELDPLLARDAELEQAVADLDAHVESQLARLESTQQALSAAEAEVVVAEALVAETSTRIGGLRELARRQAVEAYVRPTGQVVEQVLRSEDLTEASRRRAMLRSVSTSQADVIDHLRSAEDDFVEATAQAEAAVLAVEQRKADEEAQLLVLEEARADQQRLRDALAERIAEFQAEIDALAEQEDALTARLQALIVEEEARARAEAEARRRAEEAERLADLTPDPTEDGTPGAPPAPTPELPDPLPPPDTAGGLIWPLNGVVTSFFGPRWGRVHYGIDINGSIGAPVVAAQSGSVVFAGDEGGYGLMVVIDHGAGFATVYAHLSALSVSQGASVGQGAQIGAVGCTGSCTGPHLHFETRVLGISQDPFLYLP